MVRTLHVLGLAALVWLVACESRISGLEPDPQLVPTPNPAFRETPPPPSEVAEPDWPDPIARRLDNGLTVWVLDRPGLPVATTVYVSQYGGTHASLEAAAIAKLAGSMLVERVRLGGLAASFGATEESSRLAFSVPPLQTKAWLNVMASMLERPRFIEDEFERARRESMEGLIAGSKQPGMAVVNDVLARLFGPARALSAPFDRQLAALSQVSLELVTRRWRELMAPKHSALIVVGDFDADAMLTQIESTFGDLEGEAGGERASAPAPLASEPLTIRVLDAYAPAPYCAVAFPTAPLASEDYFAMALVRLALVDMNSSRLRRALRGERALAYVIDSVHSATRRDGAFVIVASLDREQVLPALEALLREAKRLGTEPIEVEELAVIKKQLLARLQARREENPASALADAFAERPAPRADQRSAIDGTTAEDVQRVAARYLKLENARIAVTGNKALIGAQLQWSKFKLEYR